MTVQHPEAGSKQSGKHPTTTLFIRNMVCNRCIKVVNETLKANGLDVRSIALGEAVVGGVVTRGMLATVQKALEHEGFELIEDKRIKTIEQIKRAVLDLVRNRPPETEGEERHSAFIARQLGAEYATLSALFSSVENITIEHYIILQKVELIKELLKYGELSISEIAYKLGYSSVQHLSNQFRQITGFPPTQFKKLVGNRRKPLDALVDRRR